jgi:hypothetical protein
VRWRRTDAKCATKASSSMGLRKNARNPSSYRRLFLTIIPADQRLAPSPRVHIQGTKLAQEPTPIFAPHLQIDDNRLERLRRGEPNPSPAPLAAEAAGGIVGLVAWVRGPRAGHLGPRH